MTRNALKAERASPRPNGWFRFPRRSYACVPTKGLKIVYPSRARPLEAARGKRVVFCTFVYKHKRAERGSGRAHAIFPGREGENTTCACDAYNTKKYFPCLFDGRVRETSEWVIGWDLNGPCEAAYGIILFIFRLITIITHQISIH